MNFNALFFPAPKVPNYTIMSHLGEIIYIPKRYKMVDDLPVLLTESPATSKCASKLDANKEECEQKACSSSKSEPPASSTNDDSGNQGPNGNKDEEEIKPEKNYR